MATLVTPVFPRNVPHEGFVLPKQVHSTSIDILPLENLEASKIDDVFFKTFSSDDDFGHIVHKKNLGTFYPSNIEELSQIVTYAREAGIPLSCRGQGHSTFGQAQVEEGIVINLMRFCKIHTPQKDRITIECGAKWKDVLAISLQSGLTPAVLTDFLGLSVGGVVSVGGFGGQTYKEGTVADNVVELRVLTMDGKVQNCSHTENADLFQTSLATLGQLNIIVEVTIKLVPAPQKCRVFSFYYNDLQKFIDDQKKLEKNRIFHYLEGQIVHMATDPSIDQVVSKATKKGWCFKIEAVLYQDDSVQSSTFDSNALKLQALATKDEEKSYKEFTHRMEPGLEFLKSNGSWGNPHPWLNVFLPEENTYKVINDLVESLTLEDTGGWPILMYPVNKSKLTCSYLQTPDAEIIYLFAILRHAQDPKVLENMIEKNRIFYKTIQENGGTLYPVGSIPMTHSDWKKHFGTNWKAFKQLKKQNDPKFLLGTGHGIFKKYISASQSFRVLGIEK